MPFATEQKSDAPKRANTNQRINDTGNDGAGSSADPCYEVKLKETDKTPVKTADDQKDQSNSVKHFSFGARLAFSFVFFSKQLL